jgi:hypothetical protein
MQSKPATFNVDVRAYYEWNITLAKLVFYTRIFNLLDIRNQTDVYSESGRSDFTPNEHQARVSSAFEKVNSLEQWFRWDSNRYSEPRRIEFGMNVEF